MQLNAVTSTPATTTSFDRPKDLKQAAESFEGMFLARLLKTAREAGQSAGTGESDGGTSTILEMAEEQLATQIAKGRGVGFAAAMLKQIQPKHLTVGEAGG